MLNLDGGRQVILPESDVVAAGPPAIVDIRQRPEVVTASDMWRYFMEDAAGWLIHVYLLRFAITMRFLEHLRYKDSGILEVRRNSLEILIEISCCSCSSFLVTVTYREYKRQKKRSQQQDWASNEQEKKEEMAKGDDDE